MQPAAREGSGVAASPAMRTLEGLRDIVVDGCLKVLAAIGALALLAGINSTWSGDGWSTPTIVLTSSYLLAYGAVLVGAWGRRVPPAVRRGILIGVTFFVAFVALLESGLLGEGRLFAFAFVIMVALLMGARAGVAAGLSSVALVVGVGVARSLADERVFGLFRVSERYDDLHHWVTATGVFVVVVVAAVVPLLYLAEHLANAITTAERAQARYRQLFEQSPAMHLTIDDDLQVRQINETGLALFGPDVVGRPIVELCVAAHRRAVTAALRSLLADPGRDLQWQMALSRGDGEVIWVEGHGRAQPPANGPDDKAQVLLVCLDLTEQRALAEQVRQSQKMEAFGQLAGGVAHDFNNLLTPIVGYADFALEHLPEDHPAREEIDQIVAAAQRAASLTTKILAFSRRQPMTLRNLDLNHAVSAFEALARRIVEAPVSIRTRLCPDELKLRADPVAIDQILMNLCVNARDAMPDGGQIEIETGPVPAGPDTPPLARLSVVDNGIGMSDDTRQRVFEPFFTTKEEGRGTGLGLSVVFGIVHQLGGRIEVSSAPSEGSRFDLFLPLVATGAKTPDPSGARTTTGTETVLLVEDDPAVRRVVAQQLRGAGYQVIDEGDPTKAADRIRDNHVHLLVSDVMMPELSGPELFERLTVDRPELRVLFVSGYPRDLPTTDEGPPRRLLRKPFAKGTLLAAVREVLDD